LDFLSTATVQKTATVRTPPRRMRPEGKMSSEYFQKLKKEMAEKFEQARGGVSVKVKPMTLEEKAEVLFCGGAEENG
jgi:hypothetical protein